MNSRAQNSKDIGKEQDIVYNDKDVSENIQQNCNLKSLAQENCWNYLKRCKNLVYAMNIKQLFSD